MPEVTPQLIQNERIRSLCPYLSSAHIRQIAHQETTEAHTKFYLDLKTSLEVAGYEGTMEIETVAVLPYWNKHSGEEMFYVRRFDVLLPEVGIAIEIDGRSHTDDEKKMRLDASRDLIYAGLLGSVPYVVPNDEAMSPGSRRSHIQRILTLVKARSSDRKFLVTEAVSKARVSFYDAHPGLKMEFPNLVSTIPQKTGWLKAHLGKIFTFPKKADKNLRKSSDTTEMKQPPPDTKRSRGRPTTVPHEMILRAARAFVLRCQSENTSAKLRDFCSSESEERKVRRILQKQGETWESFVGSVKLPPRDEVQDFRNNLARLLNSNSNHFEAIKNFRDNLGSVLDLLPRQFSEEQFLKDLDEVCKKRFPLYLTSTADADRVDTVIALGLRAFHSRFPSTR